MPTTWTKASLPSVDRIDRPSIWTGKRFTNDRFRTEDLDWITTDQMTEDAIGTTNTLGSTDTPWADAARPSTTWTSAF